MECNLLLLDLLFENFLFFGYFFDSVNLGYLRWFYRVFLDLKKDEE